MHKGQLVEEGTHAELMAKQGIYYRLYLLQYKEQEASGDRRSKSRQTEPKSAQASGSNGGADSN
jgi:hypothetical protein